MPVLYSHLYRVVQDLQGNVVPEVMATVKLAGTTTLATLYGDAEGLTTLPNPLINNPQYGSFSAYVDTGRYDVAFAKANYVFEEITDVFVAEATGGVTSLAGTPNRVLVSASFGDVVLSTPQNTDPDASIQFARLGLGTPANAGLGLLVETPSQFNAAMNTRDIISIGQVTANSHWVPDHAGDNQVAFHTHIAATGGSNRWAIYAGGTAPSYLGGSFQVIGNTQLSTLTATSNVGINGSLSVIGTLTTNSSFTSWGAAGFGTAPVGGYSISTAASTHLAANVTINMPGTPATTTLDVNGSGRVRGYFYADAGCTLTGTVSTNTVATNYMYATNNIGAGGGHDSRFSLRSYATTYCDGFVGINVIPSYWLQVAGNVYFHNALGVSTGPDASWPIACGGNILSYQTIQGNVQVKSASLYSWGSLQVDGSAAVNGQLTVYGHIHLNSSFHFAGSGTVAGNLTVSAALTVGGNSNLSLCGMGYAPVGGYWIRAGRSWFDDISIGGGNRGYTIDNYGTLYNAGAALFAGNLQAAYIGIGIAANEEGYPFHVNAEAKFRGNIRVDGKGYQPGGGAWGDTSSALLKRNIAPIDDALTLLLAQHGRVYEWEEEMHAARLPGLRYGLIAEEVTLEQWKTQLEDGTVAVTIQGFEALTIEALRTIVQRLEALGG